MNNLFNRKSGIKLTKLQRFIVITVDWLETAIVFVIIFAFLSTIFGTLAHFIIKYW